MEITPEFFNNIYRINTPHKCIVVFYTSWCIHCQNLKRELNALNNDNLTLPVYLFNCAKYKNHEDIMRRVLPYLINGYPSIIVYNNTIPETKIYDLQNFINIITDNIMKVD